MGRFLPDLKHKIMTEEKALNAVKKAIDLAYDKGKKLPIQNVINCAFDKTTLVAAWKALFGDEWKRNWRDEDRAIEMKSIIDGVTMPCRPLQNWINCIEVLRHCL